MPSLQDVTPTFVITDTDWSPLPAPSQLPNPTFPPPCRDSKQSPTPLHTSNRPNSGPHPILVPYRNVCVHHIPQVMLEMPFNLA